MSIRILAERVLPDADLEYSPGAVVVKGGVISWIGIADGSEPDADETIDLGEAVVTPGLVNAHTHLDLSHLKGAVPFEGDFAHWIEGIAGARDPERARAAALAAVREAIARGTTAFGDVVSPGSFDAIVAALDESGARARLFVEALGFQPDVAEGVFERVWDLVEMKAMPSTRLDTGVSPHAPYSVSRELVARIVAVADGHDRPLAVHLAETMEELAFLRHGIGPLRQMLQRFGVDDPDHVPHGSPRAFVDLFDLQTAPLVLVHGNYLRPRDVPARAFVVYCPTAHAFFGHPEHPALELLEEGVRVALGTDSAASGTTIDTLTETQLLGRKRRDLPARAVFNMATTWGARALGFKSGRLEIGRPADLAAFTPSVSHEVLCRQDAACIFTMIDGVVRHREFENAPDS